MRSYEAARSLFSFLAGCAWLIIAAGAITAILAAIAVSNSGLGRPPSEAQVMLATIPGLSLSFAGFLALAVVQMGRASVDTAEYSQQSLNVSRQHLELSKQLLEQGKTTAASFASLKVQASAPATEGATGKTTVSYANRPASTVSEPNAETAPAAIDRDASSGAKAITHEEQIPLAEPLAEIVYKDGKYFVADQRFWSREEAISYQKSLT